MFYILLTIFISFNVGVIVGYNLDKSKENFMEVITEEPEKKLSEKEMIIIHARIKNPSWSKAKCYQQGYPKSNLNSAYSSSTQFFKKLHIVEFMETRRKEIEEKIDIDAQYVLKQLMKIIEFNPQCMVDKDGIPIPLHKLDPDDAKIIESIGRFKLVDIKDKTGEAIPTLIISKYNTGNKISALELIGKYLKMFTDRKSIEFDSKSMPDRIFDINFVGPKEKD